GLLEHVLPAQLQPLIPKIIAGANNAMALAIGDLFWITIVAGVLGLAFTLVLRDLPLRSVAEMQALGVEPVGVPETRRPAGGRLAHPQPMGGWTAAQQRGLDGRDQRAGQDRYRLAGARNHRPRAGDRRRRLRPSRGGRPRSQGPSRGTGGGAVGRSGPAGGF